MRIVKRSSRKVVATTAAVALAAVLAGTSLTASSASFTDAEYDTGVVGTLGCTADEQRGTSTALGKLLGGTLLGLDLETLAEVKGVRATDDGTGTVPDPTSAVPVPGSDGDAYQNPLDVELLFEIIELDLTQALLKLPLRTDVGAYGQYARASADASSAAAAGLVDQGGSINLAAFSAPPDERPGFARLELGGLLEAALGESLSDLVTGLADLRLDIGAVASAASLDACGAAWQGDVHDGLERDYAIAGLDLDVDSPLVGGLTGTVDTALSGLETGLTALAGDQGLLNSLTGGVVGVLGSVLTMVGFGTPTATLSVTPDFSAVRNLLTDTISDDDGVVEIDLATGVIGVDLAALLGSVYGTDGLNGLPPNTELLINDTVINALVAAVGSALDDWVDHVLTAIDEALDLVHVTLDVRLPLARSEGGSSYGLGTLVVHLDASLGSIRAGTASVTTSFERAVGLCSIILVGAILCGVVDTVLLLVNGVLGLLGSTLRGILILAIDGVIDPIVGPLGTTLAALTAPIVTLLASTLGVLFGSDGLVGLLVNAQNDPDPDAVGAGPEPDPWAGLPGPVAGHPFQTGRYDVAALRLSVVGGIQAVEVELARSAVGSNVVTG